MFSGCNVPHDSKESELGSSDQDTSPWASKNIGVVLVPCLRMEVRPTAISSGVHISEDPGCHLLRQVSSQWGSKNYFKDWCLINSQPTFLFFNLFKLNELWPYYQKHVNQIILNRTTLWSLALRIFEAFVRILLIVNLSLNQTLLTFLLCVRQTWMTQLILASSLWEIIFL